MVRKASAPERDSTEAAPFREEVYSSISKVTADILAAGGIDKERYNKDQKFYFRGIEDVLRVVSPLLVKHRLVVLQNVVDKQFIERENKDGKKAAVTLLTMSFTFVSTIDGSMHTVESVGEGKDFGDKATNKAMSIAYKYAMILALAIPTEVDEQEADDEGSHSTRSRTPEEAKISEENIKKIKDLARTAGVAEATICKAYKVDALEDLSPEQASAAASKLQKNLDNRAGAND